MDRQKKQRGKPDYSVGKKTRWKAFQAESWLKGGLEL